MIKKITLAIIALAFIQPAVAMENDRQQATLNKELLALITKVDSEDSLVQIEKLLIAGANANIKNAKGSPLLISAVEQNSLRLAQLLLNHRADANITFGQFGTTALMVAAMNGHEQMCQMLIANGARVNSKDGMGLTAWTRARQGNHRALCALLENHGAHVEAEQPTKVENTWVMTEEFKRRILGDSDTKDIKSNRPEKRGKQ